MPALDLDFLDDFLDHAAQRQTDACVIGLVIFSISDSGYSLFWSDGDKEFIWVDWKYGMVFAPPPDMMWHQHFNSGPEPARYLAVAIGGIRYPFLNSRRKQLLGIGVSAKDGGGQIEYQDQDPRIHTMFLNERAQYGGSFTMKVFEKS